MAPEAAHAARPPGLVLACGRDYFPTTGSDAAIVVDAALQVGCPQPPALMPDICPACGVMSYTMLSGRVVSPLTLVVEGT